MITFFDAVKLPIAKIEKTRVDCGTCPVSLSCIVGQGGNGWKFDCCGATGYPTEDGVTIVVDCAKNNFEQNDDAKSWKLCPLCSGGIMEVVERARIFSKVDHNRYLLTAYAKVPLVERIELWKKKQVEARALIEDEQTRKMR